MEATSYVGRACVRALVWVLPFGLVLLLVSGASHAALMTADVAISCFEPDSLDESRYAEGTIGTQSVLLDRLEGAFYTGTTLHYRYHGTGTAAASGFVAVGTSTQVILEDYSPLSYDSSTLMGSTAQVDDMVTVAGSGPGFIQYTFNLSGMAANSNPSLIRSGLFFNAFIAGDSQITLNSFSLGYYPTGDFVTAMIPITFGTPFRYFLQLQTFVQAVASDTDPGPIISGIFYGDTARLTALAVFDQNGNPIAAPVITSDSGTTYNVPEPASALVLLAGTGLLALVRRGSKGR